jgi:4a-hydroxytetrahydrobiopterin dehydratase
MNELGKKRCQPCEGGIKPLTVEEASHLLIQLPEWHLNETATSISRTYQFKNYYETIAFVNAVAWIAHQEDHHSELTVSYNRCTVCYSTHAIAGLSENDFICATKVDMLLSPPDTSPMACQFY